MSRMYLPTLRQKPAESELPSHQLLLRAGMIRKLVSGVYSYLPLGYRVLRKIEKIVREEMDFAGGQEVLMSAIQPKELWEDSGRWEAFGPEMFRLKDRNEREFCLGPTHEEIFTELIRSELKSYKQLPLNLYQIQTKYRDERRPRFGLIRAREFLMKDAYSFDMDEAAMKISYKEMWRAYEKIFNRCNLNYRVVEGDAGAMGDSDSHEFMAMCDNGESTVVYCPSCDYSATDEKAICSYEIKNSAEGQTVKQKIFTPDIKTIEALKEFFDVDGSSFVKTLLFEVKGSVVAVCIPGDRELNVTKLMNLLKVPEHEIEMASPQIVEKVTGAEVGFAGPINLKQDVKLYVDARITKMTNFIVGANETNYHIKNVNYGTDFEGYIVDDLLVVQEGDLCPRCSDGINLAKGIEVGNIFQLATKYSEGLKASFLDENGREQFFWMGSYGIGVSRTLAAVVEQNYDEIGIKWPLAIAPYHVIITIINPSKEDQLQLAEGLYTDLKSKGIEVLLDDRKGSPGVKLTDADLIGIPIRIVVGKDAPKGEVELKYRHQDSRRVMPVEEAMEEVIDYVRCQLS
ncbi:proline--tRNA ligase [Alkaliphilus peptidifermentans]|nr:proline--tRNA ligase [Alkaliphilus peptidifermentans]